MRGPGGGEAGLVMRRGRIRVDARKAIAKLREHLLVDLHLYAVEVVRAAVLAGATRVDVTYDADDVIVAWGGEPLAAEDLPRLFEHLTAEADTDGSRFARLLALAVNAALGLAPAWISVTTASGGAAAQVVWTPDLVAAIEREERDLPAPESVARPSDMPETGMRFQLRRKVGWDMVRRAAAKTAPREVALVAAAAHHPRAPLFVNGEAVTPPPRARALARAPIALPGARTAFVEIAATTDLAPYADFCELGLSLARAGVAFGRHFPMAEHLGVAPPVRIVIDADALPTNASRSAVREDAPMLEALGRVAAPALSDLLSGIAATLFGRGSVPDGVTVDASSPDALHDALGTFLCAAEASLIARVTLPDALRALLDLPLFRDGLGRPLAHAAIPREDPLLVWTGKEPVPAEMEPWARSIVWRRGSVAERVLASRTAMDPKALAERAQRGAERYQRLMALPAGPAAVPEDGCLGRARFAFDHGPLAGLRGEVLVPESSTAYVRNRALRVFLQGRCFETFAIPEGAVPLPVVIAVEWPGHVVPRFAYEGVESTPGLRGAVAIAARRAVMLCDEIAAGRARARRPWTAAEAAIVRAALATAVLAPSRMVSVEGHVMPPLAELGGLVHAPVWPLLDGRPGERFTSLLALGEYAQKTGAVCVVAAEALGRAPDDRPVVRALPEDVEQLRVCLDRKVEIIQYDAALLPEGRGASSRSREQMAQLVGLSAARSGAPILRLAGPGSLCLVTLGEGEVRVWHGNAPVGGRRVADVLGGVAIALDDDSIVPDSAWQGVLHAADGAIVSRAELAYAERLAAAVLGDERARAELTASVEAEGAARYAWPADPRMLPSAVRRYLVDRAARGRAIDAGDAARELGARVEMIPLCTMLGEDGEPRPASLADVDRVHPRPGKVPWLEAPPGFRPVDWRPVVCNDAGLADALSRFTGGRLQSAVLELPAQERRAATRAEYAKFLLRPKVDVSRTGPRGDAEGPAVHLAAIPAQGIFGVAAALPARDAAPSHALVEVTLEERVAFEYELKTTPVSIVCRVSVTSAAALDGVRSLSPDGERAVSDRVRQAATALALRVIERASQPGAAHTFFGDLRALHLVLGALMYGSDADRVDRALRQGDLAWPTVQGGGRPWGQLRFVDGELWAGTVTYASWITTTSPTDLDRPILHVPPTLEGSALVGIVERMRMKIRPVSDALATLQARRSKGGADEARLAARPPHPALVRDLHGLSVEGLAGELGIFESGEAVAEIHTLDGDVRRVSLDVPFPARAVARTEVLTASSVAIAAEKLGRAALRLMLSLAPMLHELPPFVRSQMRAVACRAFSKGREVPAQMRAAPLFVDVDGELRSLADLVAAPEGHWTCTFDPPPYPKARQEGCTLVLTPTEHLQLHTRLAILNVTEWMRRDLEAERRREGPQVPLVRFDAAAREHMITSFVVDEGSLTGEIGLLHPRAHEARGVQLLFTRRPVCKLDDGAGWPLAAVLNDDTLHPNRWFIEILPAEETALRAKVRELATAHLKQWLSASLPEDRRAETFVSTLVPPAASFGSTEPMTVTGWLHLPHGWPAAPSVRLFATGADEPVVQPLALASAPIDPWLPASGALFVSVQGGAFTRGAACRLALAMRDVVARSVAALLRRAPDDPDLHAYAWNLRLLGAMGLPTPALVAADGRPVTPEALTSALEHGPLWLTDHHGSTHGAFPEGEPPFVLFDSPSPLLRVLRARVARDRLKFLGGVATAQPVSTLAPPPPPSDAVPEIEGVTGPAPPESRRGPSRSWLGGLVDRVTSAFAGERMEQPPATGIGDAVERALRALRLRDQPVVLVAEARRGKLVRYDRHTRVLTINVAHPALAKIVLAPSPAALRRACLALTAAALTEVNVALEHVTDVDEVGALLELLRQDAAAAADVSAAGASPRPTPGDGAADEGARTA